MEIDYFLYKKRSKKEKGKKKILQRERIPHLTENPIAIKSLPTHYKVPKYLHLTVISTSVNQYNTPTVHKLARAFISELVRDPSVCTGRPASLRYIFCFGIKIILKLKILFFLMFEK